MEKTFKLKMVEMPNFICIEMPARQRQDGFNPDAATIPGGSMSVQEATEYAEEMKQAFIDHWEAKKKVKIMHKCTCKDVQPGTYANQIFVHAPAHMPKENGYCLDACIAQEIMTLWQLGITTTGCCCGHGKVPAYIGVTPADAGRMKGLGYSQLDEREEYFMPRGESENLKILIKRMLN